MSLLPYNKNNNMNAIGFPPKTWNSISQNEIRRKKCYNPFSSNPFRFFFLDMWNSFDPKIANQGKRFIPQNSSYIWYLLSFPSLPFDLRSQFPSLSFHIPCTHSNHLLDFIKPIMVIAESEKPNSFEEEKQHKQFDREVREMVSAITHRLSDLHKPGSSSHHEVNENEHGARIITLAGTNSGASLRSELDEKIGFHGEAPPAEFDALSTFVNSNFQAVNNSIMMGAGYTAHDPGVHLDVSDFVEPHEPKPEKKGKKGKKKKKDKEAHSGGPSHHSDSENT